MKAETGHSDEGANTTLTSEEMKAQREAEPAEAGAPKVSKRGGRVAELEAEMAMLAEQVPMRKQFLDIVDAEGGFGFFIRKTDRMEGTLDGLRRALKGE